MASGFGSFMQGALQGYSFVNNIQRENRREKEREEKLANEKAASESMADALQAQQGVRQKVSGPAPTNVEGQPVAGPPSPEFKTMYDPEKEFELQVQAIRDIGKAYGPEAAMRLNDMFRVRQEHTVRKAAGDVFSAVEAGDNAAIPGLWNRVRLGGYMEPDSFTGDKEKGFTFKLQGEEQPRTMSYKQLKSALSAKSMDIKELLAQETHERQLAAQEGRYEAAAKHDADSLAETTRNHKVMEGIYADNNGARNSNAATANLIRAQGVSARRDGVDKRWSRERTKTRDKLGNEAYNDLAWSLAKSAQSRLEGMGFDPEAADRSIQAAFSASGGDPALFEKELALQMRAANEIVAGRAPAGPAPSPAAPAAPAPTPSATASPAASAAAPAPPTRGINAAPPVPAQTDPLAGMRDEGARKMREKLLAERKRYDGRPEAAGRIREIDALIGRIDRRDY